MPPPPPPPPPPSTVLAGVKCRHSRLSDVGKLMDLFDLRKGSDDGGLLPSALLRSSGLTTAADLTDLIQTSFLCITATIPVADPPSDDPAATTASAEGGEKAQDDASEEPSPKPVAETQHRRNKKERIVGFLAVAAAPRTFAETGSPRMSESRECIAAGSRRSLRPIPQPSIPPARWDDVLHSGLFAGKDVARILPSNTLWLTVYAAPSTFTLQEEELRQNPMQLLKRPKHSYTSADLMREMLTTVFSLTPRTSQLLFALPSSATAASAQVVKQLRESFEAQVLPFTGGASMAPFPDYTFSGELLCIDRGTVIPPLVLRAGRIEDYDDFVPLLVAGDGVMTELPGDLYLEETLKDQDSLNKVAVAENANTHEVVGLACAHVIPREEQLYFAKTYALEPFNKLRPTAAARQGSDRRSVHSSSAIRLDFVYFNRDYDGSAHELIVFLFKELFPTCEYIIVTLPHAQEETPMLKPFSYLPLRQYQPHNSRGEYMPVPPGLWVCSRESVLGIESFHVDPIRTSDDRGMSEAFLHSPALYDLKRSIANVLLEDLAFSLEEERIESRSAAAPLPGTTVFQLTSGEESALSGVASARRVTGRELYALQYNYDLDAYLSLYTHTGRDYSATDENKPDQEVIDTRNLPELSAVIIRGMYVRAPQRTWVRFFIREILRRFNADIAVVLSPLGEEAFTPLMQDMVLAKPRRVVEMPAFVAPRAVGTSRASRTSKSLSSKGSHTDSGIVRRGDGEEEEDEECLMPDSASALAEMERIRTADTSLASLRFTTQRFLGDEKSRRHTRIVVVGASATGTALLHALVLTPFVSFSNLVLISTDGLPPHPNQQAVPWAADHMELREREYLTLQQGDAVRVVSGNMVDLDKVNKYVSVDNGTFEPYDYLILTTGRQYVLPPSVKRLLNQEGRTGKKSVIPLNGESARGRVSQALVAFDSNPNSVANVMVYGSGLDALAAVSAMVEEGFSPQRIVVCARDEAPVPSDMDESTYQSMMTLFRSMGINAFRGYDVSRMEFDDENNLSNVLLAPVSPNSQAGQSVELACCLILCMEDKDIDPNILSALNKRSIVFDGRVIVSRSYRTTDAHVFAAGPVAMWTRRYGTATPNFEDFNAKDVGDHLATVLLGQVGFHEYKHIAAKACYDSMSAHKPHNKTVNEGCGTVQEDEESGTDSDDMESSMALTDDAFGEGAGVRDVHEQLRKKLPVYTSPMGRRVRAPKGYHFYSVQRVQAALAEKCDALICNTIDRDKFISFSAASSPTADDAAAGGGSSPSVEVKEGPTAATDFSEQSVMAMFVNRDSRCIDGIFYFGLEQPDVGNYRALIGLPETLVNLTFRYQEAQRLAQEYYDTHSEEIAAAAAAAEAEMGFAQRGEKTSGLSLVNLPAFSGLTAGVRGGQLDLIRYLRLPHLQTIYYDRFGDFFQELQRRMRAHEEGVKMRQQILTQHKLDRTLSLEEMEAYQQELTERTCQFKYTVQLSLLRFLHDHKNFRPPHLYLPSVEGLSVPKNKKVTAVAQEE